MAAVVADPGGTVPTTATADEGVAGPGPGNPRMPEASQDTDGSLERRLVDVGAGHRLGDGGDREELRHVRSELEPLAVKALPEADELVTTFPLDRIGTDPFSLGVPGDPDGIGNILGPATCRSVLLDPQLPAVFLHSFPAPPPVTEAGLSLAEPAEPTTNITTDRDRGYTARSETQDGAEGRPIVPGDRRLEAGYGNNSPGSEDCRSPSRRPVTESGAGENLAEPELRPEASVCMQDLSLGSEVRVCLDHVIDDALVVSFRLGEKLFSGVLMDVSKRFGPYGIPITVFSRRGRSVITPQTDQQLKDVPSPKQEEVTISPTPSHVFSAKLPPLFQEGAPYPPPLFIRDTYNQALPQPPPRKIKRPKRRYRSEEPTSIMNAIKLRPRQVLCDKCKGMVTTRGHREARRAPVDLRGEEVPRQQRPADRPVSLELKRLRNNDRRRCLADRRTSGIRVTSPSSPSSSSPRRILRGVASSSKSSSNHMRLKLNSTKALSKNSDSVATCQVLQKLVRTSQPPNCRSSDQTHNQDQNCARIVTRASALQNQKVHFTRRLQHTCPVPTGSQLPPRMRLKPQRYRTEESQVHSSSSNPPLSSTSLPLSPSTAVDLVPGDQEGAELVAVAPPPSSDSLQSDGSSTETFDLPPPRDLPSTPPLPSSSPLPKSDGTDMSAVRAEEDNGSDLKRRRKSSSSSAAPIFSKSVSKCPLPDGRSVCIGDIVWAKIYGFPWWPARVLGITVVRHSDTGLAVQQEARVSWFGSPTTSFLALSQLSPFLESFQLRFDRKRKGPYRRAIAEAASAAKQLTPEVRALLTQFET